MTIECIRSPTVLVSSFTLRASAVYLQRGIKLDRGAQDGNARDRHSSVRTDHKILNKEAHNECWQNFFIREFIGTRFASERFSRFLSSTEGFTIKNKNTNNNNDKEFILHLNPFRPKALFTIVITYEIKV